MLKFISLLILVTSVCQVWTYDSFADYPLVVDPGDYIIHATLTDLSTSKKYYLQEYIYSNFYINGKISISSSDLSSPIDVHYGSSSPNQRLSVQGYDCDVFVYKTKWDKQLPGITKPLINHILLVGPSLIYRLKHREFIWQTGNDAEIRGTAMKKVYRNIGANRLTITVYYKDTLTSEDALLHPSRIKFSGIDPSDEISNVGQDLILDIYLQTKTDPQGIDKVIIPKPGIGCPTYFAAATSNNNIHLNLARDSVHFIAVETINGPTKSTTRNEIFIDEVNQISSIKTTKQGKTSIAIYDYTLGLVYENTDGRCKRATPMGLESFSARADNPRALFRIETQFFSSSYKKYVGQTWFENRPGLSVDVWESVVYNESQYDKVVTTIYTADSAEEDTSFGFIPVGKTVNAYKKGSTGYSLIQTTTTDYYDFRRKITKEEYDAQFRIDDCYSDPSDRKTLAIHFNCRSANCDYAVKKYVNDFEDKVRDAIVSIGTISGTRIGNIDIELSSNTTIAFVTFLNFPNIEIAFRYYPLQLSSDTLKGVSRTLAPSLEDCLKQNANMATDFEAVVYCNDQTCARISKIKSLVEGKQNRVNCMVYETPLKNLKQYNQQAQLNKIQDELKSRGLGFSFYDGNKLVQYMVSHVDEVTEPESKSRQLFVLGNSAFKFIDDGTNTMMATKASNFAECYRACANFDENACETFSFCQLTDKTECLLSTSVYANLTDKRIYSLGCNIYRKNRLSDYIKISNREFINSISISTNHWIDHCADLCSQSDECFSFQASYDGKCSFGGYYTDSTTKYSHEYDIYIPKVAHKFALTGHKIVTETYHTELNLTMDQCAALCYGMGSNDVECKSFNFCPRGGVTASSCSLSKYSVKDSSTKTIDSDVCTNYGLIPDKDRNKQQNQNSQELTIASGTSAAGAFSLIVLFIAVGLVIGLVGTFVYNKSKKLVSFSERDSFNWNKHSDEDTKCDQTSI